MPSGGRAIAQGPVVRELALLEVEAVVNAPGEQPGRRVAVEGLVDQRAVADAAFETVQGDAQLDRAGALIDAGHAAAAGPVVGGWPTKGKVS
jgi:hypothetical protein